MILDPFGGSISIFVSGNEPRPVGFAEFTPDQISMRELGAILKQLYSPENWLLKTCITL